MAEVRAERQLTPFATRRHSIMTPAAELLRACSSLNFAQRVHQPLRPSEWKKCHTTTWLDSAWLCHNGLRVRGILASLNAQRGLGQKLCALAWADLKVAELTYACICMLDWCVGASVQQHCRRTMIRERQNADMTKIGTEESKASPADKGRAICAANYC